MIIIKNKFGNVALNLDVSNIVVRVSGGFDSAVLLYMLASEIDKNKLKTVIHTITAKKVGNETGEVGLDKFDSIETVNTIISFVKRHFPAVDIRPPRVKEVVNWWINEKAYRQTQLELVLEISELLNHQNIADYSGVTKNPDIVIGQEFFDEADHTGKIVKIHRNPEKHRDNFGTPQIEGSVSVTGTYKNITYMDPFRNADKRLTVSLAENYGILDFLLENTRSCEGRRALTNNFTTTCDGEYKCWWCHEREWALKNYDK